MTLWKTERHKHGTKRESGGRVTSSRAIAIVVANMLGTGVYTTLGLQALEVHSISALLFIWITGGAVALCGALSYAELAVRIPRSGGEYIYLTQIYHPAVGFVSGFISMTIGFTAPLAMAAIALGHYLGRLAFLPPMFTAVTAILILAAIHMSSFRLGVSTHVVFTAANIAMIVFFVAAGLWHAPYPDFRFTLQGRDFHQIMHPSFAVSLVYVSFAYAGWNSATYITQQIENPRRNLPRILTLGTVIVMGLYTALNFVFLYTVPLGELRGRTDVAMIAAGRIFGTQGGRFVSILIAISLLASMNSLYILGPRVAQALALDHPALAGLARENRHGAPFRAVIGMTVIALILLFTSSFQQIMTLLGFSLSLFTILTVAGVFVLRRRQSPSAEGSTWRCRSFVPALFILLEGGMALYVFRERPLLSLVGVCIVSAGYVLYVFIYKSHKGGSFHEKKTNPACADMCRIAEFRRGIGSGASALAGREGSGQEGSVAL